MKRKLARVQWKMGQTLLPDHFMAQEDSILADTLVRYRMSGLPTFGLASLKWNPTLVEEGVVSISSATIVMPSGQLLDVPGNARISPLNLNVPGVPNVTTYLHLMEEPASSTGDDPFESSTVPRTAYQLQLTTDAGQVGATESMKLAEFRQAPDGAWQLSDRYIPPLVQVGTTPFLMAELDEVVPALEVFQYKLAMDSASYLSGAALFKLQSTLRSLYRTQRLLTNVRSQVHLHPYHLLEALKDFYIEVCFYRGAAPKNATTPYRHDQLSTCFREVIGPLMEQMQLAKNQSPYEPFVLREGIQRLDLPADINQVNEIYFLIQHRDGQKPGSIVGDLKFSSPSRLSMVHKLALEGIPLRRAERPALAQSFGPEVDFYQVARGEEWEQAVREGTVAFYHRTEYEGVEFYLYWNRS